MTAKTDLPPILPALAGVALIDAPTCAAPGQMSVSWWHEKVRTGEAPAPVVQQPRCTRWKLSEVALFWQTFAAKGLTNTEAATEVTTKAKKASAAAQLKRRAAASQQVRV